MQKQLTHSVDSLRRRLIKELFTILATGLRKGTWANAVPWACRARGGTITGRQRSLLC